MGITIGAKRESDFTEPLGMLSDCHRRIERFLDVLLALARQARGEPLTEEQRTALETSLRYFREAAPKHTADEEESLFPRLRQIESPELRPALARMEALQADHRRADESHGEVERLGQSWLARGRLSPAEATQFSHVLAGLAELYRRHIGTEDNELFPFAAAVLTAADREAIGAEMTARRGVGAVKI